MIEFLGRYDERVNNTIPHSLISKTEDNTPTPFSSERLLVSLVMLGIPLPEALSVMDNVEELLKKHVKKHPSEFVTTWHLRKLVFDSLNLLDPKEHDRSEIEKWGSAYARRFGNPDNRISIVLDNGESEYLTFYYLVEQFIPTLISEIMNLPIDHIKSELISNKDIQRIANELISIVQFMHIYEINYETLYRMARDIAVNPPHPWMVNKGFDSELIKYDINRATEHSKGMIQLLDDNDLPNCRHKCIECLDHSSSALLAYYGLFMGTKPFFNLFRILNLVEKNPLLWKNLMIRQLEGDFASIGKSLMDFQILLGKAKRLHGAYKRDKLEQLVNRVEEINSYIFEVLKHRQNIQDSIIQMGKLNELDSYKFDKTVTDVFASIPDFKKLPRKSTDILNAYWFQNDIHQGGILHRIEPRVLVMTFHKSEEVTEEDLISALNYFEVKRVLCNTIFVVTNQQFSEQCQQHAFQETRPNDKNIILVTPEELQYLYNAKNRVKKLGELIMDFYDRM